MDIVAFWISSCCSFSTKIFRVPVQNDFRCIICVAKVEKYSTTTKTNSLIQITSGVIIGKLSSYGHACLDGVFVATLSAITMLAQFVRFGGHTGFEQFLTVGHLIIIFVVMAAYAYVLVTEDSTVFRIGITIELIFESSFLRETLISFCCSCSALNFLINSLKRNCL